MSKKNYKTQKNGAGRFVQLPEWFQRTEAWATLTPGPRALYIELKRRFTGSNNGRIVLSHRDAATALNVHRNTVGRYFDELAARGFIAMRRGPFLGPSGIGQSSHWVLTELPTDDLRPATKDFTKWRAEKPRTEIVTPRHDDCATRRNLRVVKG